MQKEMNLHQKMLKIANMAGVLQKTASGYSYKYVPEEDIQAKVTAGLQKYGVMLYTSIVPGTLHVAPHTYQKYDAKLKGTKPVNEVIVHAEMLYTWVNAENPDEKIETAWALVGQMEDAAQAFGAGLTYGNRYYLLKQLQLATTEADPDAYRSKQKQAEHYEEEAAEKEAAELLAASVQQVVEAGTKIISGGLASKADVMQIVANFNDGNGNPSSISSVEICEQVLQAFDELKKASKTTKE